MKATANDIKKINDLYAGRRAYFGDLHNHAETGGTSDGHCTLTEWREGMKALGMDFAAILDHRQVRHMYLPEWEDGVFIGGSEPGANISDSKAEVNHMHYNMIFAEPGPFEELLHEFSEFGFTGGMEGHFGYPDFTVARMRELIARIKEKGGFYVFPHPTQITKSDDPLDYWFADETGFEVFYYTMTHPETEANYKLWCTLLDMGKRLWACSGEDAHMAPSTNALTVIYAEEQKNASYLSHLRCGDFICGSVGIRMCIGDILMGGKGSFDGNRLVVSVKDFHNSVVKEGHKYSMVLLNDKGIVAKEEIFTDRENVFAIDTEDCRFYRAEVIDETENLRIAIGNPIWNA